MKRIALLVCGFVLIVANTAEARRQRWSNNQTYAQPVAVAPTTYAAQVAYKIPVTDAAQGTDSAKPTVEEVEAAATPSKGSTAEANNNSAAPVATVAYSTSATNVRTASYSTSTAQGVANLMASYNRVGHFGGNPGYEGCGCGATAAAAYSICFYGNSGMTT